ncbi:WHIM1 motif-containing protein [Microdochium nivale]|nr:WHIM1 motif-containing protein [Microdochium nivale]
MSDDDSSDLSSLSSLSPAPPDEESDVELKRDKGILKFFHKVPKDAKPKKATKAAVKQKTPSPPPPKRSPSPPHDYVLADNSDIAFLVMFRSRFNDALPKSLANFGPQELERDVTETTPGERVEHFLCSILGLLLNRKQDVKPGHYNRALEDAISTHKSQWARDWEEKNPLSGGQSFTSMNPTERLTLLRTLVIWALASSDIVKGIINQSYKQNRHEDDLNQPLSVQPWGSDSDRRRYFLIEGLDDTAFRVYRESNPAGLNRTWWSVAGNIDELNTLVDKLQTEDGGPRAKKLAQRMLSAIPRFEATEEKRKRREYRVMRKEQFKRPEPGFSMYEGRTRGKRIKYTYSDEEDFMSDSTSRRSARNTGTHTPAEPTGPVTTASGRQVKAPSRMTVDASNNIVTTGLVEDDDTSMDIAESTGVPNGRPRRSAATRQSSGAGWDDEDEEVSEPELGDDEGDDHVPDESEEEEEEDFNEDEEMADDDLEGSPKSLVVKLKVPDKNSKVAGLESPQRDGSVSKEQTDGQVNGKAVEETESTTDIARKKNRTTPDPSGEFDTRKPLDVEAQQPPLTPASNSALPTSLAFRGSPEKTQAATPHIEGSS